MDNQHVIEMKQVVKQRDNFRIGPLNICIPQGCVTAIIGTNGSGKTTMLGMCLGLVHPDEGKVTVLQEKTEPELSTLVKARIGFVAENSDSEEDDMTAEQVVSFVSQWYPSWDWQLYHQLMAKYELPPKQKLSKLSKGMRRKLDLIVAICPQPELLLLDEPSSGFDPLSWRMMINDLHSYLKDGKRTVLIATHIVDEVKRLADYILIMHKGKVLHFTEKDTLFDAWKVFVVDGEAADYEGAPGLMKAMQERFGVRLIAHNATGLERFLHDEGIEVVQTHALELDDILAYMIEMHIEGSVYAQ
ncbi:ABC transporter ATP-binding protein [Paenibacillus sp. NAIST15-1]|uniref:ABC transporter ATP-binding protein n=1 Tax=Paenibacillus sp. NAIST15-1 TaxID=1605994 RepID=UPI00086E6E5F|nr:ABC transporter ATP-binding protein [Paenibacillus sp. NAIST15-1]GAV14952.1 ABC transporter, ATP-binding protein [Paenibacillus sp. NAIST15-1]